MRIASIWSNVLVFARWHPRLLLAGNPILMQPQANRGCRLSGPTVQVRLRVLYEAKWPCHDLWANQCISRKKQSCQFHFRVHFLCNPFLSLLTWWSIFDCSHVLCCALQRIHCNVFFSRNPVSVSKLCLHFREECNPIRRANLSLLTYFMVSDVAMVFCAFVWVLPWCCVLSVWLGLLW